MATSTEYGLSLIFDRLSRFRTPDEQALCQPLAKPERISVAEWYRRTGGLNND